MKAVCVKWQQVCAVVYQQELIYRVHASPLFDLHADVARAGTLFSKAQAVRARFVLQL